MASRNARKNSRMRSVGALVAYASASLVAVACRAGWRVRQHIQSPRSESQYLKLEHSQRGRVCLRISAHGGSGFVTGPKAIEVVLDGSPAVESAACFLLGLT